MRLLMRTAAAVTCLLLVTAACGSETTNTSESGPGTASTAGLVEPGFRTVLEVDMREGVSGEDSRALTEKYGRSSGVQEARGGDGDTLFIFSSGADADEIEAVRQALVDESSVEQVNVTFRK